jgi:hypothetical protein
LSNFISLLLQQMIDPNPEKGPSVISLIRHRVLSQFGNMSQAQLHTELNADKLKIENAERRFKSLPASVIQQCRETGPDLAEDKPPLSAWISGLVGKVKWMLSTTSV